MEENRDTAVVRDLQMVRQEAARAGQIVRNLLAFVRRGSPDRKLIDLNEVVRAMADLREFHLAQRGVTLTLDLAPTRLPVVANRDEIQQIIINILLNGEHALQASGTAHPRITIRTHGDGAMHSVQISDNGPGISQELKGRIFEPFFTTKEVGEGTGLGLSISIGIARAHGGALELCDPPGGTGACFRLTIPAAAPVPSETAALPAVTPVTPANGAAMRRALVVEDEVPIRQLVVRLLERRGYSVVEAASRGSARDAVINGSFDVVLCDLRLADGSGTEVVEDIRAVRPDISRRIIFVTGDASGLASDPDLADMPVLPKPFTSSDLDRALNALMASA